MEYCVSNAQIQPGAIGSTVEMVFYKKIRFFPQIYPYDLSIIIIPLLSIRQKFLSVTSSQS